MSKKINCIAIDDEPNALALIERYCGMIPELEYIGGCENPFEASEIMKKTPIELMFLDLNMNPMSGISFLRVLPKPPVTVLMTGFPEFLAEVEAHDLDPADILMKPISARRFRVAVNRAMNRLYNQQGVGETGEDLSGYSYFKVGKQYVKVDYDDILYLEAMDYLVKIHTVNGMLQTATKINLARIEEQQAVPTQGNKAPFLRIHRSYIISIDKITAWDKDGSSVTVDGKQLPVGGTYRKVFLQRMGG